MFNAARLPCSQDFVRRYPRLFLIAVSLYCCSLMVNANDTSCQDGAAAQLCTAEQIPVRAPDEVGVQGTSNADLIDQSATLDVNHAATLDDEPGVAQSYVVGIDARNGDDVIHNSGTTSAGSEATAILNEWRLHLIDFPSDLGVGVQAEAAAVGIDAGRHDDYIRHSGALTVDATSDASSRDIEIEFIGLPADVNATTSATSLAIGIEGGDGNDDIGSKGSLDVTATANTHRFSGNFTYLGAGSVDSNGVAQACAIGLNGGSGDDLLWLDGETNVSASAETRLADVQFEMLGVALGDAVNTAAAGAVGIAGGEGNDFVGNGGTLNVTTTATTVSTDIGMGLAVDAIFSESSAHASSTGLSGGDGFDIIANEGELAVTANADVTVTRVALTALGRIALNNTEEVTLAQADAIGYDGGADGDSIRNATTTTVTATADTNSNDIAISLADSLIGDFGRAPIDAIANATGIDAGSGDDNVKNDGTLDVSASAVSNAVDIELNLVDAIVASTSTNANSTAIGIDGGEGIDLLANNGTLTVNSHADADVVGVLVSLVDATLIHDVIPDDVSPVGGASTASVSNATGMDGGAGNDWISNSGTLDVTATADTDAVSVSYSETGIPAGFANVPAGFAEEIEIDAGVTANAYATGINAGSGNDHVTNDGTLITLADTTANHTSVSANLPLESLIGSPLPTLIIVGSANEGTANAIGIDGSAGNNTLINNDSIDVDALATGLSVSVFANVDVDLFGVTGDIPLNWSGTLVTAATEIGTTANGILAGENGSHIFNNTDAALNVNSETHSAATVVDVRMSYSDTDIFSVNGTVADTSTIGTALSNGIVGSAEADLVDSAGDITVDSLADTNSTTVTVALQATSATPFVAGANVATARTLAEAQSTGIGTGAGDDDIYSRGAMVVSADTNADAVGVDVGISGATDSFFVLQGAWIEANSEALAQAEGISGGAGADYVNHSGSIDASTLAEVNSVTVSVEGAGTTVGAGIGVALATAETIATANTIGINTDVALGSEDAAYADADQVINTGTINAAATTDADADTVGVSVGIAATQGFAGAGSWADASTNANASALGIATGGGDDTIYNSSLIDSTTTGYADSVGVSVSGAGTPIGFSLNVALARAITETHVDSTGIAAGDGNDVILTSETADTNAHATADTSSTGVSVEVGVTGQGLTLGGAVVDTSTIGTADAIGIDAGLGRDQVENHGDMLVESDANVDSVSVSAAIQGAVTGVAGGAALSRSNTTATANSTGILLSGTPPENETPPDNEEDKGKPGEEDKKLAENEKPTDEDPKDAAPMDVVFNDGTLTVDADADAVATSVSVELAITGTGLSAGAALAGATTNATANAAGIVVEHEDSLIINEGMLDIDATADTVGASVAVNLQGTVTGVALGASITDATVVSHATSTGIRGGTGIDMIAHSGDINATSLSDADAASISANITAAFVPGGAALADATVTSTADAFGIDGGANYDIIETTGGSITTSATATATGTSVAVNVLGASLGDNEVHATSNATGIAGGAGYDTIYQDAQSSITGTSTATANGAVVSVTLVGAAMADATNTANARTLGFDGGAQDDVLFNAGSINSTSTATARATGVTVALTGAALNNAVEDANTVADAYASGISGGANHDELTNAATGSISSTSTANTRDVEVSVTQLGAAIGDVSARSDAYAYGLDGESGNDWLWSEGGITTNATADARGTNVAVNIIGAALANVVEDSSIHAGARAAAQSGGDGHDRLHNFGISTNTATATTGSVGVSVALEGAAMSDASTNTIANAFGMDAGAGHDKLYNDSDGSLSAVATATSAATTVDVNLIGAAIGDSRTRTEANARGMAGGSEGDVVENAGMLNATASASTDVTDVGVSLLGASLTDISTEAHANAAGITGDAGVDTLWSIGTILATATSDVVGSGNNWNLGGASIGDINTTAFAFASGMHGGDDNDLIVNEGTITATSIATGSSRGTAVVILGGFAAADAVLTATATATGIAGGTGDDVMENHGAITSTATATNNSRSINYGTFGAANGDANTTATANAYGMNGGEGADQLLNTAAITSTATATTNTNNKAITIGGYSEAEDVLAANANAIGLLGAAGEDWLRNQAELNITATANMTATSSTVSIFGAGSAGGNATMSPTSIGIDGGLDNDVIENLARINVTSSTTSTLTSSNFTFGGAGQAAGDFTSRVHAIGIVGADGDDTIQNEGDILATANSTSTQNSSSTTIFGTSAATGSADANPLAINIDGGAGNDTLINTALLDANTSVSMTLNGGSFTFAGTSNAGGVLSARTTSIGIRSGADNDFIYNEGTLDIDAVGTLTISANPDLAFGSVNASSVATADPVADGIDGEGGNDELINAGVVNVRARGSASSTGASYSFAGGSASTAVMTANATATGMGGGTGNDVLTNTAGGSVIVLADAVGSASGGTRSTFANANLEGTVSSVAVATGMSGGTGDIDMVDNLGSIDVDVLTNATSNNSVDAGVLFAGGVTRSRATTDGVGYGIRVDGAQNHVWNSGSVNVLLDGDATAKAYSDGEVVALIDVDSHSRAYATVDAVHVYGISGGHGSNAISNTGSITVAATPYAYAETVADGDGVDGDGTAYSNASTTATSYGISVGNGNNGILNDAGGVIDVNTTSNARAYALSDSDVGGSANSDTVANSRATAFGIRTGNGDNYIVNNGTITVNATAIASTYTRATNDNLTLCAPFGLGCTTINFGDSDADAVVTRNASAYGIYTGNGDDVVFNRGTITTSASGGTLTREAIHTGAGNDNVILGDGSTTNGNINLGADNDTLTFIGTPIVNGSISGNEGTNTLAFESDGAFSFDGYVTDFSTAVKTGVGTYTVTALMPLQSIEVQEGTFEIKGDYQFQTGSTYIPSVMSGGDYGQLVITGNLDFSGSIDVRKGDGHHIDGESQVVLHAANGITGSIDFDKIKVPEATPLLAFNSQVTANDVVVNTAVKPFETVAGNKNEQAIAEYMDKLLPQANGDISVALGEVQAAAAGEHGKAFKSLSPEGYVNSQQAVKAGFGQYAGTVQQRTRGLRQLQMYNQFLQPGFFTSEQGQPLYHLPDHELGTVMNARQAMFRTHGSWFKGFQQSGQLDQSAANTGFNFDTSGVAFGFDAWLDQKRAIGASMASTTTDMRVEGSASDSDIDSQIFSVYGTYATDKAYVDGGLSYGDNSYTTRRTVTVGGLTEQVFSEHDGDMFGASFGAGLFVPVRNWKMEMYTALNYLRQKEDGFAESGAGGINLNVAPRSANSLMSELGLRFGRHIKKRSSDWYTEAGIAWLHEFREDTAVEAGFADAGSNTFIVEGQDIDDDGVLFNLGVRYVGRKGLNTSLEYRTEQRGNYSDDMIAAQLQYRF